MNDRGVDAMGDGMMTALTFLTDRPEDQHAAHSPSAPNRARATTPLDERTTTTRESIDVV